MVKRFDTWAERRLEAAKKGPNPLPYPVPLQVIEIGDIAFVTTPMEVMCDTGMALRAASPKAETFVLGYTNGMISYLPTPQVSKEGGMEARLAYKSYFIPAEIPGDWEPVIKEKALEMLKGLCDGDVVLSCRAAVGSWSLGRKPTTQRPALSMTIMPIA